MVRADELGETATGGARASAPNGSQRAFRPGDVLGRYTVERALGTGGMGIVYAAHDPDLDRRIAIKVLRRDAADESRVRLLREARALAKVSHPNVVTVYEVGTAAGVDFVAMELLEGGSLSEWLRGQRRTAAEVLRRFRAAGQGLAAAHAAGLVHRDFKPSNVLLGKDGRVVVTDFGLARGFDESALASTMAAGPNADERTERRPTAPVPSSAIAEESLESAGLAETVAPVSSRATSSSADLTSTLTRTGTMLGTPAYMAPEQYQSHDVGPAADQFAFAVALWEGLTGSRPYRGDSIEALRAAVEAGPPDPDVLPRAFRPVLVRALSRRPSDRWPDVAALLKALDRRKAALRLVGIGAVGAALTGTIGTATLLAQGSSAPASAGESADCALLESDLESVLSPDVGADLATKLSGDEAQARALARVVARIGKFRAGWREVRAEACAAAANGPGAAAASAGELATAGTTAGRLTCLSLQLDQLRGALAALAEALTRAALFDQPALIPDGTTCRGAAAASLPPLTDNLADATMISAIRAEAARAVAEARWTRDAIKRADDVVERAKRLAQRDPFAQALALTSSGRVRQLLGECREGIPYFEEAATLADAAGANWLRAEAKLGHLECVNEISTDAARIRAAADPARAAISRAGADAVQTARLRLIDAQFLAVRGDLDRAIDETTQTLATLSEAESWRDAVRAAHQLANFRLARGAAGDDAEMLPTRQRALSLSEKAVGSDHATTSSLRWELGYELSNTDPIAGAKLIDTRCNAERARTPKVGSLTVKGRVLDATGKPVRGARVATAQVQVTTDYRGLPCEPSVETGDDGGFEINTEAIGGLYAFSGDGRRSHPVAIKQGAVATLRLLPSAATTFSVNTRQRATPSETADKTLAIAQRVHVISVALVFGEAPALLAAQGRRVGSSLTWAFDQFPTGAAKTSIIAMSPFGDLLQQLTPVTIEQAPASGRLEATMDLSGSAVDVVVRAERGQIPSAEVRLLAGRLRPPAKMVDFAALMTQTTRLHTALAIPHGPDTETAPGKALYQPGDLHARFSAVQPGPMLACALPFAQDIADPGYQRTLQPYDLEPTCQEITVTGEPLQAFVLEASPVRNRPKAP